MNKIMKQLSAVLLAGTVVVVSHLTLTSSNQSEALISISKVTQQNKLKKMPRVERKKARADYFTDLLRDPVSGEIPRNVRLGEIAWKNQTQVMKSTGNVFNWVQAGPLDVGGRTRGLAVDIKDANTILAAGVSGGIWKSTNKGSTWSLKTPDYQNKSVTWLAQDPRDGHSNIWYASTGEFDGSSASASGAFYLGYGIFKSIDNGESWVLLESASNPNLTSWNSRFDLVNRIQVNPVNGDVYFSSHAGVLVRSRDGGATWEDVLGDYAAFQYVDFVIANDGTIVASLSGDGFDDNPEFPNAGIFKSTDDAENWTEITPSTFPETHYRTFMSLAPSNQNTLYVLTLAEAEGNFGENRFFRINLSTNTAVDRSSNVPNFGGSTGDFDTQFAYNMILAVRPNNENFVIMGGTNLFRSTNGFGSALFTGESPTQADRDRHWIGGYTSRNTSFALYTNHHPDQHSFVFDPSNPNAAWSGHDGGLSYTTDINANIVSWTNKNAGYYVTQFYHASISRSDGNKQLVGGTQDNGSPFFTSGGRASFDLSSGDGAFSYFGKEKVYVSSQNGNVYRYDILNDQLTDFGYIDPNFSGTRQFIHPFEVDKNNESVIYFPLARTVLGESYGVVVRSTDGGEFWSDVANTIKTDIGLTVTALETSISPADILYFSGSDRRRPAQSAPILYKLVNASTSEASQTALSLPGAPIGSNVSDIAVNPNNANEILVTLSNYNVEGIFYSNNGNTFVQVEGNLAGDARLPGPSIRSAAIVTINNEKVYLVGTSTGIYSTKVLDGNNTIWIAEGTEVMGNSIVNTLSYRESDGHIVAATHGRGAFYGEPNLDTSVDEESLIASRFELRQNYPNPFNPSTTISFELKSIARVQLSVYDVTGRLVRTLLQNETRGLGVHSVQFDASNLASGTYMYSLQVFNDNGASYTQTKKMTLIK